MSEHSERAVRLLQVANDLEQDIRALEARVSPSFEERIGAARRNQAGFRSEALVHALLHLALLTGEPSDCSPQIAEGSPARQGLDQLLSLFPTADVVRVDSQWFGRMEAGVWTIVDLSRDGTNLKFAIWNRTGNVYRCDERGAVEGDAMIEVTPL